MPVIAFETAEAWPEGLRELAKKNEETGKFELNVAPKAKVDEFRTKNIEVSKSLETSAAALERVKTIFGDELDDEDFAEKISALKATAQRVADGDLSESTDIEAELAKRTKQMREDFEARNQAQAKELAASKDATALLNGQLKRTQLNQAVLDAVMNPDTGANPEALAYIQADASKVFSVEEDGTLIPRQGDATIYGADGATPMTVSEWLTKHVGEKTILAKPSAGGGSGGGTEDNLYGYSKEDFAKLSPIQKLELANKGTTKRAA